MLYISSNRSLLLDNRLYKLGKIIKKVLAHRPLKQYTHGHTKKTMLHSASRFLIIKHSLGAAPREEVSLFLHTLLCAPWKRQYPFIYAQRVSRAGCKNFQKIHPKICSSFLFSLLISCCLFTHAPVCIESWDTNTRCICVFLSRQLYYKTRFLSLCAWYGAERNAHGDIERLWCSGARLLEILEGDN